MDPTIARSMELIAEEAERQGFQVRQLRGGTWHFRRGSDNWTFNPTTVLAVLDALSLLISAGFDWTYKD